MKHLKKKANQAIQNPKKKIKKKVNNFYTFVFI